MTPRQASVGWRLEAGALLGAASAAALAAVSLGCERPSATVVPPVDPAPAEFVDESSCAGCHEAQHRAWVGSHHDLAMQEASGQSVLGDFGDVRFTHAGATSRFFRRGDKFFVQTDGPDGELGDFEVKHAFGVDPLQQYLVDLPGGRLQALPIAWGTGIKRWFHLYPDERIDYRDELHWTGLQQNWNYMCGECHTTGYRKNYDAGAGIYETEAARFDVGCQACHGPASRHVERVERPGSGSAAPPREELKRDFDVDLSARSSRVEIETCARCHSRRSALWADYRYGGRLMDTHLPALISEGLYYADGQIQDEVYVYGSFLQSRMYAKGVRCSDCHDSHSARMRAPGNARCTACHGPPLPAAAAGIDTRGLRRKDYDSPEHHHHKPGEPGAQCVDCHAPARSYMGVDPRHDHSFRIPRPDLSIAIGVPNACNGCHPEHPAQWAADVVAKWYGTRIREEPHYGQALDAGRRAKAGAVRALAALASDASQPAIVRATALELISRYPGRSTLHALRGGLRDSDPMVRYAAVVGQELRMPDQRIADLAPLLEDPVRAVRIEAARQLAPVAASIPAERRESFDRALAEFEAVQMESADRPEALASLGNSYLGRGEALRAERMYRSAIALDPGFVPAYANLADLYRATRRDRDAERVLREGLRTTPDAAALHEALGLALVRQGKRKEALSEFVAAVKTAPNNPRHAYIHAVALHDAGRRDEAIRLLEAAAERRGDRDVLLALAAFRREAGDLAGAERSLHELAAINPDDPALAALGSGR